MMARTAWLFGLVVLLLVLVSGLGAARNESPTSASNSIQLERGRYLVEQVAMCQDCHSPRDEKGEFIASEWMSGAELGFQPTMPMPAWAGFAPDIAGFPGYTDKEAIQLLMSAELPDGTKLDPPMPYYKMSQEDAAAAVAYLRSLRKEE